MSEESELVAKEEFSAEEGFSADFEPENLSCEGMDYFCNKGTLPPLLTPIFLSLHTSSSSSSPHPLRRVTPPLMYTR